MSFYLRCRFVIFVSTILFTFTLSTYRNVSVVSRNVWVLCIFRFCNYFHLHDLLLVLWVESYFRLIRPLHVVVLYQK